MRLLAGLSLPSSSRALIALGLSLWPLAAQAQPQPPPAPRTFFSDSSGVVPADVAARIEERLREFERASSNQVLVVVADRIPDGYGAIEEYTNRTAEAWRVGDKGRDNGAVLFVFVADRKIRIEVGYGLEGALPDALASRIINDEITPRFRERKYGEGLMAGVEAIIQATRGEYQPLAKSRSSSDGWLIFLVILFFVFMGVVVPILRMIAEVQGPRTYSGTGTSTWKRGSRWGSGGGFSSWGGSSRGGSSWGGGGGGFSGGGGSFGGGGASGSW